MPNSLEYGYNPTLDEAKSGLISRRWFIKSAAAVSTVVVAESVDQNLFLFLARASDKFYPRAGLVKDKYDSRISRMLALLASTPATEEYPDVLEANHVSLHFIAMPPGVYARYSVARHTIEIDERWIDVDEVTLAALVAHEATHAQDAVSGYLTSGGVDSCIGSEVKAFKTSALFWLNQYGREGKPDPKNVLDYQMNEIAERQLNDPAGLESLVRQTYGLQCSH